MRFQGLDLNLLVALDALLTDQNVSVAASRIHLSQSAMSGALNRLREYFRDALLVPAGRRMVLTPRAEQLAGPVRTALLQIKNTITTTPEFDPSRSDRHFRIIASDYATVVAVSEGLKGIAKEAPWMTFHLSPVDGSVAERLERDEVDLLLTLEHAVSRDHPSAPLFEDDYVVVAWSGNTAVGDTLDEDTFFRLGHVAIDLGPRVTILDAWYLQSGMRVRRIEVTVPSFTLAPYMVVGTDRITTMHRRLATHLARSMPLRLLPPPFDLPRPRQVIQWHRLNESDPATAWVRHRLMAAVAEPLAGEPLGPPTGKDRSVNVDARLDR